MLSLDLLVPHPRKWWDIPPPSWLFARNSTSTPTSAQYFPCVPCLAHVLIIIHSVQVASQPGQQPAVDLVVVRENTECLVRFSKLKRNLAHVNVPQYVKQEQQIVTENGKEARATRLITEKASRRIGQMALELALSRPRKVGHGYEFSNFSNRYFSWCLSI